MCGMSFLRSPWTATASMMPPIALVWCSSDALWHSGAIWFAWFYVIPWNSVSVYLFFTIPWFHCTVDEHALDLLISFACFGPVLGMLFTSFDNLRPGETCDIFCQEPYVGTADIVKRRQTWLKNCTSLLHLSSKRCAGHLRLVRAHRATPYDARIDCNEVCNIAIETIRRPRTLRWRGLHRCRDPKNFMSFQNVKIWGFSFFLPISSFYAFFDFYPEMQSQRVSSARVPATDLDTGDTGTWKSRRRNHKSPLEGFGSSFALELL